LAGLGTTNGQPSGAMQPLALRAAPFVEGEYFIQRSVARQHETLPGQSLFHKSLAARFCRTL